MRASLVSVGLFLAVLVCVYICTFKPTQNQHVMLPEAAKKVRFLRSDFKRRMEADGKTMTPDER